MSIGIEAIGTVTPETLGLQLGAKIPSPPKSVGVSFGEILMRGLASVDAKVASADALVQRFAVDDSVPVHQVTIALEQARVSVELAMQVRTRLIEGYREIMNMQL